MDYDYLYIYQLKNNQSNRNIIFVGYDDLVKDGQKPKYELYNCVYSVSVAGGQITEKTLDNVYLLFNNERRPMGFCGHSLSISDVIVIERPNEVEAYYVDEVGFVELPEFAKEHMLHHSSLRNNVFYELQAGDIYDIILSLEVVDDLSQDEIKEIVDNAKYKLSLDYGTAIQALIENYIADRDYNNRRRTTHER